MRAPCLRAGGNSVGKMIAALCPRRPMAECEWLFEVYTTPAPFYLNIYLLSLGESSPL